MNLKLIDLMNEADASHVSLDRDSTLDVERVKALTLSRLQPKKKKRLAPRVLLAAAIAAALTVSALAAAEFRTYDRPGELLESFFGNREQKSLVDATGPYGPVPDSRRTALEPEAAHQVEAFIGAVDQKTTEGSLTLTVHGHLYDSVTGCGILYYTLEDPEGIAYQLQYDGMIWDIPVDTWGRHGYSYLLQDRSTDTRLEIAEYYIRSPRDREPYIQIGLGRPGEPESVEAEFDRDRKAIRIPLDDGGGMAGLSGKGVKLSPMGLAIDTTDLDFLYDEALGQNSESRIRNIAIRYADGSTYEVLGEDLQNYVFAAASDARHLTLPFNRLVDLEQVSAVELNGHAVTGLQPIREEERLRPGPYVGQLPDLDTLSDESRGSITFGDITLTPESLGYSPDTRTGTALFTLTTGGQRKDLFREDRFSPISAGLQTNQVLQWRVLEKAPDSLKLAASFVTLEEEPPFLKLWFAGSPADPRLNQATENLICLSLEEDPHPAISLAEGNVKISDLGMVIDYKALGIRQGDRPRDLSLQFRDGSQRILSCWDEDILEGAWLDSRLLRGGKRGQVWISFDTPIDPEALCSVTYSGQVFPR